MSLTRERRKQVGSTPTSPTNKKLKVMIEEDLKRIIERQDRIESKLDLLLGEKKEKKEKKMPKYMTLDEASEYTGMHKSTLRVYCSKGLVEFVKVGKSVRFRTEALDRFMNEDTRRTTSDTVDKMYKPLMS